MTGPRASMRLQFHKGFGFAEAAALAPYMAELGISHLYASPIMTAQPGSMHGYDVIDPTKVNPELGGEDGLRALVSALHRCGLGLIVDIVPNHMAADSANPWWNDVLRHGRASRYAEYFDIDWDGPDPSLHGKVLVPLLGRPYGEALRDGELKLASGGKAGAYVLRYFDNGLPIAAADSGQIDEISLSAFDPKTGPGRERLHRLLERQNYRLAWWRTANDEINWRRFFDINGLVALRMENEAAFDAVHATVFHLYSEGLIDGLRIDHVDGLSFPGDYCRKLRQRLSELERQRPSDRCNSRAYVVVEKILAENEALPAAWDCDGTTGYDFMDAASAVLHDARGEKPLTELWSAVSGRPADFGVTEEQCRRRILEQSFAGQLNGAVRSLYAFAQCFLETRDFSAAAIRRALTEILAHFPVYRIYAGVGSASDADRFYLGNAIQRAQQTCWPQDREIVAHVGRWLSGERPAGETAHDPCHADSVHGIALTRFQQLSAPLSAKAVEDTAFYRYGRILSRNDVGFDPRQFSMTPDELHRRASEKIKTHSLSMLATATHDHKRGEDVRARLAVLSEIAGEWADTVDRWLPQFAGLQTIVDQRAAPSAADLYMLLQTIVGAWPPHLEVSDSAGLSRFCKRLCTWQQKALREAKLASSWSFPNEAYENAAQAVIEGLFGSPSTLLTDIARFAHQIGPAGAANGLAQTLLKLTAPGVPDIYQGTEYWDLSLVDPDNRMAVNFDARERTLAAARTPNASLETSDWRDGHIKQALIARVLAVRRAAPELFTQGDYVPLEAQGPLAAHVMGYMRSLGESAAVVLIRRHSHQLLLGERSLGIPVEVWRDTHITLPDADKAWKNVLKDARNAVPSMADVLEMSDHLATLPVALLVRESN